MSKDEIIKDLEKEVLDALPEEKLLDFDAFLVGDGSAKLAKRQKKTNSVNQLIGTDSLKDRLRKNDKVSPFAYKKDIAIDYVFDEIKEVEDPLALVKETKHAIFDKYGYYQKRSEMAGNTPLYEEDLTITSKNYHYLEYLKAKDIKVDERDLRTLATLFAFSDMRIMHAKFINKCFCPLCDVYDNVILDTSALMDRLMQGFYVHPYCECELIPVLNENAIVSTCCEDLEVKGVICKNVPIEYKDKLIDLLSTHKIPQSAVVFTDIALFFKKNGIVEENNVIIYPYANDNVNALVIHNDYVWDRSPVDFLQEYLTLDEVENKTKTLLENGKVFYVRGVKAVELDGQYYSYETGDLLDEG